MYYAGDIYNTVEIFDKNYTGVLNEIYYIYYYIIQGV